MLKEYEQDVVNPAPDAPRLAEMEARLNKLLPAIRDLMVMNFTGPSAIKQRQELQQSKEGHVLVLFALLAIGLLVLFVVSREMKLQYFLAWNDPLTLLPNRSAFINRLERLSKVMQPSDNTLTICLIELNNFKEVNDSLGYAAGDELLTMVANQISAYVDDKAFIARMGGDEFALFIYGDMPIETRVPYLVRLLDELKPTVFHADPAHRVRVSMGISQHPITAHKIEELILFADIALANAKKLKENHLQMFNHRMFEHYSRNRKLAAELREELDVIANSTLYLHYQPVIKPGNAYNMGAEVLIRWHHCEYGFINPLDIIAMAEENGLGELLGKWIFNRVNHDMSQLPASFVDKLELAINLSNSMFTPDLFHQVSDMLQQGPLKAEQLILELTETIALDDLPLSQRIFKELKHIHVRIALDDFGTGWSSFSYLMALNFDKLKIDKSFVSNIQKDPRQFMFVESITNLSHRLGLVVVAEGVENHHELQQLSAIGVDEIQGYYYSKPLPPAEFFIYAMTHLAHSTEESLDVSYH